MAFKVDRADGLPTLISQAPATCAPLRDDKQCRRRRPLKVDGALRRSMLMGRLRRQTILPSSKGLLDPPNRVARCFGQSRHCLNPNPHCLSPSRRCFIPSGLCSTSRKRCSIPKRGCFSRSVIARPRDAIVWPEEPVARPEMPLSHAKPALLDLKCPLFEQS
jgi:hypothetical protein